MNRSEPPCAATTAHVVGCDVAAVGRVHVGVESLPELRRRPGPVPGQGLPATFLKNSDEQTVFGLAAVYHAVLEAGLVAAEFDRWAVIAAPHKIGRTAMAQALPNYRAEGAWGMSPHLIPQRSLHCPSGAISCALKAHGPNFGVGDGPSEALPIALAMLQKQRVDGVWLIFTACESDRGPDTSGVPVAGTTFRALALALVSPHAGWQGLRLRVGFERPLGPPAERRTPLDLVRLQTLLEAPVDGARSAPLQDLGAAGRLELCVEGQLPAPRHDTRHVPVVRPPHANGTLLSLASSHGAEAQR